MSHQNKPCTRTGLRHGYVQKSQKAAAQLCERLGVEETQPKKADMGSGQPETAGGIISQGYWNNWQKIGLADLSAWPAWRSYPRPPVLYRGSRLAPHIIWLIRATHAHSPYSGGSKSQVFISQDWSAKGDDHYNHTFIGHQSIRQGTPDYIIMHPKRQAGFG